VGRAASDGAKLAMMAGGLTAALLATAGSGAPVVEVPAPWARHIRASEAALAAGDHGAADRALHRAYLIALPTRSWEGLLEVGDAHRRAGDASGPGGASRKTVREHYLTALARARQQSSLDGVLRIAERFAAIPDRDGLALSLRAADDVLARLPDPEAREQGRTAVERLAGRLDDAPSR
jgi:hypothetical protein